MKKRLHSLTLASLFFSLTTHAAVITAVKEKQVLINIEDTETQEGSEFYAIDIATQKKTALIRITKLKDGRAVGNLIGGKAEVGFKLTPKGESPNKELAKSTSTTATQERNEDNQSTPKTVLTKPKKKLEYTEASNSAYGFLGGYVMSTLNAEVSSNAFPVSTDSSMAGTGFAAGGFYEYNFTPTLAFKTIVTLEQFSATASTINPVCSNTTTCNANINYMSFYGQMKWVPLNGTRIFWLAGGMGYLYALTKSSTALKESQIASNTVYSFSIGSDISMGRRTFMPISIDYNLFPSSSTVSANQIILRTGWAWNL